MRVGKGVLVSTRTVLLVDDEAPMLRSLARVFARSGWCCECAASPLEALDVLRCRAVHAMVADYVMEPFDGVELCRRARGAGFGGPLVIYTGHATRALRESAARAAAWAVIPKDTKAEALAVQLQTLSGSCAPIDATPTPALPSDRTSAARAYARAHGLSQRETEVLEHALVGEVRKQSADGIGCHPGSVARYWRRIYRKTNTHAHDEVVLDVLRFVLEQRRPAPAHHAHDTEQLAVIKRMT